MSPQHQWELTYLQQAIEALQSSLERARDAYRQEQLREQVEDLKSRIAATVGSCSSPLGSEDPQSARKPHHEMVGLRFAHSGMYAEDKIAENRNNWGAGMDDEAEQLKNLLEIEAALKEANRGHRRA